jgi:hypothetical protein
MFGRLGKQPSRQGLRVVSLTMEDHMSYSSPTPNLFSFYSLPNRSRAATAWGLPLPRPSEHRTSLAASSSMSLVERIEHRPPRSLPRSSSLPTTFTGIHHRFGPSDASSCTTECPWYYLSLWFCAPLALLLHHRTSTKSEGSLER